MTVVGGTGDYMVQGIANQSTGADGTSKFAAGDIRMDLTGYGSEIYGIINGSHGTNGNNAVDFKAGDIIIEANNDGNVIGITNKMVRMAAVPSVQIMFRSMPVANGLWQA